jgi:hypothetical protein
MNGYHSSDSDDAEREGDHDKAINALYLYTSWSGHTKLVRALRRLQRGGNGSVSPPASAGMLGVSPSGSHTNGSAAYSSTEATTPIRTTAPTICD